MISLTDSVLEQRLERTVAEYVGADVVDESVALGRRESELLGGDDLGKLGACERVQLLLRERRVVQA